MNKQTRQQLIATQSQLQESLAAMALAIEQQKTVINTQKFRSTILTDEGYPCSYKEQKILNNEFELQAMKQAFEDIRSGLNQISEII